MIETNDTPFDIWTAPGFEAVGDAFRDNFARGQEHGAGFCAYQNGELIADLRGGWADRKKTQKFSEDTLVAVFSSGKAAASLVIAFLADEDRLGYDTPLASIWPEIKDPRIGALTVAQIMSHQSGLSGITNPHFKAEDWLNWDLVCGELEAQEPLFPPGTASGYSPVTFGFLAGEIAKRVDIHGRTLGEILREDICEPHNLDVWIGLPEAEHARCADMLKPRRMADFGEINDVTRAAFLQPWSSPGGVSKADWRTARLAGSNCHATAKSLARLMRMAMDGSIDGQKLLAEDVVTALRAPRISGQDMVLPFEITFVAGIMKNTPNFFYGPNPEAVGHSGWGGSCVFADPAANITAAYVMTQQDNSLMGDPRALRLISALYESFP